MPPALLGKPIAAIGGVVLADRRLSGETGGAGSTSRVAIADKARRSYLSGRYRYF